MDESHINFDPASIQAQLESGLERLNITLPVAVREQLITYLVMLHKWQGAYNLVGFRDPRDYVANLLLESLVLLPYLDNQERIVDVGTGAGVPGMILAICLPQIKFYLLDSRGKKIAFLRQIAYELQLANVELVNQRVERYSLEPKATMVISRAFSELKQMVDCCHHLLVDEGKMLSLKSKRVAKEVAKLSSDYRVRQDQVIIPGIAKARFIVTVERGGSWAV